MWIGIPTKTMGCAMMHKRLSVKTCKCQASRPLASKLNEQNFPSDRIGTMADRVQDVLGVHVFSRWPRCADGVQLNRRSRCRMDENFEAGGSAVHCTFFQLARVDGRLKVLEMARCKLNCKQLGSYTSAGSLFPLSSFREATYNNHYDNRNHGFKSSILAQRTSIRLGRLTGR